MATLTPARWKAVTASAPPRRRAARKGACLGSGGAALLAVLVACAPEPADVSERVQLVLAPETLAASSTFELRFEDAMVDAGQIGRAARLSPLVIAPSLRGRFTWLSQRSGVFQPDEPLALATRYRLSLRPGLKDRAGAPLRARLRRTLRTPDFEVWETYGRDFSSSAVPHRPELGLYFNADVRAAQVQPYLEFRDGAGQRVPARVLPATTRDRGFTSEGDRSRTTWKQAFVAAATSVAPPSPPVVRLSDAEATPPRPVPNGLIVVPETDLPLGQNWKLVARAGLPAAERGVRLASARQFKLGAVVAFGLRSVSTHNGVNDGKRIALWFNKRLPPEVALSNLHEWIALRPAPTNLTITPEWSTLALRGDFQVGQTYTLTVRAGLPCYDGGTLGSGYVTNLQFAPLPPRLYFPATETVQLLRGRRTFDLLAVNTGPVRVRVKQLDRSTLVHALRGYRSYQKQHDGVWDSREPYREVDYRAVPGRTIHEAELVVTNRTDEPQRWALPWDNILGAGRPGAIFVAAEQAPEEPGRRARQGTQALVQLTDLGLAWKLAAAEATVFVFSHTTGLPVANASVRLLTDESDTLSEGTTDGRGLARLALGTNAVWVLAELGPDLHAERLGENPVHLYSYGVRNERSGDADDGPEVFLFSDRSVYRPGETVHLKGVVRQWKAGAWALSIPAGLTGTLALSDPKQDRIFETNLTVSAAGALAQDIPLPEGVRGHYHAVLRLEGREYHQFFQVQDFQPNAFNIVLDVPPAFLAAEPVRVPVTAHYYMGAPLSRARVRWSVEAEDAGFEPEGFEAFQFCTPWLDHRFGRHRSSFATHGEAPYSTNLTLTPDIPLNPAAPQPRAVHLRVEITDLNQQTIARADDFVRHSSDFYLGIKRLRDVSRAGDPLAPELIAVQPDGQPRTQPVEVTLTVQRVHYHTVRVQGAGRAVSYRSELTLSNVLTVPLTTRPVRKFGTRWDVQPGAPPAAPLWLREPGHYLLEARARDAGGREVVTVSSVYLHGPQEMAWPYRNDAQLSLVADKPQYLPGDTATLLVQAPLSGHALVTVERDTVRRAFVTELRGNAPAVQVPIEEADAPNVFVSVLLLRGSADSPRKVPLPEHRLGYCELRVENPRTKLDVRVRADSAAYRPAQAAQVAAEVRDVSGRPVAGAEVTLYAVDEGILSLTGNATPDPHAFFFQPRPLRVQCGLTLPSLLPEDPDRLVFGNKGYLVGGGGRERLRKDFLPCAFWQAALVTDADGQVAARFTAPDSLTRYRVMAVAHTRSSQFGHGQAEFEVNKPLMLEPALPRFAHVTDRLLARAVVHNRTEVSGRIEVSLHLDDRAVADGTTASNAPGPLTPALSPGERRCVTQLTVRAQSSAPVEFPVALVAPGTAEWTWTARFAETATDAAPGAGSAERAAFRDAVQSTLPVGHVAPLLRETYLGRTESAETNLLAHANPQLLEGEGSAIVRISNTRLSELDEAVSHLLHYPYGCVEQTGSSLLPWLVLRHAPGVGPGLGRTPAEVESTVRAGLQRLLSMQTAGGGLAYWPGGREPMFWGSAYGGMILALARRDGRPVSEAAFDRLMKYLSGQLRGSADATGDFSARCLAAYALALAGRAEPSYHEVLRRQRDRLSLENRALLALAILESEGPASQAAELLRPGRVTVESDDWFGGGARQLAVQLLAWSRYRPADPAVDTLAAELMQTRRQAHWSTTQGNAWALFALTDYARRVEGPRHAAHGTLTWAGKSEPFRLPNQAARIEQRLALRPVPATPDVSRPTRQLATNDARTPNQKGGDGSGGRTSVRQDAAEAALLLANPDQHRLYTQVRLEVRSALPQPPRQDRGYAIRRTYAKLDDAGVPGPARDLRVGDRILVTLEVQVHQAAHFVAVDDPLPALFEALNPEFKSQETGRPVAGPGEGREWLSDFRELRADRALFFRDHLEPGRYLIRYLARVRAAGTATAPAPKVEEMYHPERFGLGETAPVHSRPLE